MKKMIVFAGLMLASVIACTDPYADEVIYEIDESGVVTEVTNGSSNKLTPESNVQGDFVMDTDDIYLNIQMENNTNPLYIGANNAKMVGYSFWPSKKVGGENDKLAQLFFESDSRFFRIQIGYDFGNDFGWATLHDLGPNGWESETSYIVFVRSFDKSEINSSTLNYKDPTGGSKEVFFNGNWNLNVSPSDNNTFNINVWQEANTHQKFRIHSNAHHTIQTLDRIEFAGNIRWYAAWRKEESWGSRWITNNAQTRFGGISITKGPIEIDTTIIPIDYNAEVDPGSTAPSNINLNVPDSNGEVISNVEITAKRYYKPQNDVPSILIELKGDNLPEDLTPIATITDGDGNLIESGAMQLVHYNGDLVEYRFYDAGAAFNGELNVAVTVFGQTYNVELTD